MTPSEYRSKVTAAGCSDAGFLGGWRRPYPNQTCTTRNLHLVPKAAASRQGGSVLIVDDDEGIGDTLATVLRHSGFRAHTALDGALAWETVEREKPDIVVTDYWITPVDGLQLIRRIRSRFVPGPLLGLMTADICLDWDIRKELQRSGVGIIDKPFWSEEFVTFVQNLIARQDASPRG